jgi:hypothetical protein
MESKNEMNFEIFASNLDSALQVAPMRISKEIFWDLVHYFPFH